MYNQTFQRTYKMAVRQAGTHRLGRHTRFAILSHQASAHQLRHPHGRAHECIHLYSRPQDGVAARCAVRRMPWSDLSGSFVAVARPEQTDSERPLANDRNWPRTTGTGRDRQFAVKPDSCRSIRRGLNGESARRRTQHLDAEPTLAVLISPTRGCRSDSHPGT